MVAKKIVFLKDLKFELPYFILRAIACRLCASLFTSISLDDFTRRKTSDAVDQFRSQQRKYSYFVFCLPFNSCYKTIFVDVYLIYISKFLVIVFLNARRVECDS